MCIKDNKNSVQSKSFYFKNPLFEPYNKGNESFIENSLTKNVSRETFFVKQLVFEHF